MKRKPWNKILHLFAKCMDDMLRILFRTGQDPAAILGVILAFFGVELFRMRLKSC